jgi:hypothetical protein
MCTNAKPGAPIRTPCPVAKLGLQRNNFISRVFIYTTRNIKFSLPKVFELERGVAELASYFRA